MHAAGLLAREERGLYRLAELPPLSHPDVVLVARRAPKLVRCARINRVERIMRPYIEAIL